jgi:hypothetical protein
MNPLTRIREGPRALLERDAELGALSAALERAGDGEGSVVTVVGAAGTGKSELVLAAVARARELGLAVRRARGSELEQTMSFGVIRQLFEAPLRLARPVRRAALLSGAAAAAARLFADAPFDQGPAGDGGFATIHGLYWLATALAMERPLLLAVDDVHWSDAPSLRALVYLAGRIADVPIALVVAARAGEPARTAALSADLESQPGAERLEIGALGEDAVAEIVRARLPDADDGLCAAFHESSAGNPFYLGELLRAAACENGGRPTAARVREAAIASVGERVMRRLAALGADAPGTAAAMSVLGASGRLRDAAAVAGLSEEAAAATARGMRKAEILAADDPIEWVHPLVRRSIYDQLTITEREALHARAADVLGGAGASPAVVASHLVGLRPAGSARVAARFVVAADDALARDAPEVAVGLLRRALEEDAGEPPRASLLLKLGQVEATRRDPAAIDILREARALADDPRSRTAAALSLIELLINLGQWDSALVIVTEAIGELYARARGHAGGVFGLRPHAGRRDVARSPAAARAGPGRILALPRAGGDARDYDGLPRRAPRRGPRPVRTRLRRRRAPQRAGSRGVRRAVSHRSARDDRRRHARARTLRRTRRSGPGAGLGG